MSLFQDYLHARCVSTPIIGINTADQPYTVTNLLNNIPQENTPILAWDCVRGLVGLNDLGKEAFAQIISVDNQTISYMPNMIPQTATAMTMLRLANKLPERTILICHNAQVLLKNHETIQAIANLRDLFKGNSRTLTLLGPKLILPPELQHDITLMNDPLPTLEACAQIITEAYESAAIPQIDQHTVTKGSKAIQGLSPFAAEQNTALSLTPQGIHLPTLWERKYITINQAPGLHMWQGKETFNNIGGVQEIKQYLNHIFEGKGAPQCIVFLDEIEKQLAGSQTQGPSDNTGVAQAFHGELLAFMQDTQATGLLFTGPQGTCKSHLAKAAGHQFNVPTISMSLSGMKTSLVGASESNIHQALETIKVLSGGTPLFIGTCNTIQALSPELRRRFQLGTFFFDLPTTEEKDQIWKIYHQEYTLGDQEHPKTPNWSGSDIQSCSELAWRLNLPITTASQYIIPTSQASPEHLQALRSNANQRFLSASYPGAYQIDRNALPAPANGRAIQLSPTLQSSHH